LKELDGFNIPDLDPTVDGSCASFLLLQPMLQPWVVDLWWLYRDMVGFSSPSPMILSSKRFLSDIVACPEYLTWELALMMVHPLIVMS